MLPMLPSRPLPSWGHTFSTEDTNGVAYALSKLLWDKIESPLLRDQFDGLLSRADYRGLCDSDPLPTLTQGLCSIADYRRARQIRALWEKREDLDLGIDKKGVAFGKFLDSEKLCFETNQVFKALHAGQLQMPPKIASYLHTAQNWIARTLGDLPPLEALRFRLGPGSTTTLKRTKANTHSKLEMRNMACSGDLTPILDGLLYEMPALVGHTLDSEDPALVELSVHEARLDFVPKNYASDRSICVEPGLNLMYQLGIGQHIADCLRREGIDITDQRRNQEAARVGSITGALATLDLSSASDTVSTQLVWSLLPIDWAQALAYGRSSTARYGEYSFILEKFSSMGNGFTFPLETLIFASLAHAVCSTPCEHASISVYGDDIIVPTHLAADLTELLRCCGFVVNTKKSFTTGFFRESCGADYYSGIPVRPVYLRGRLSGESLFTLHNGLVRNGFCEEALALHTFIAQPAQIFGPDGFGDGHLLAVDDRDVLTPCKRVEGYAGFTFETYSWTPLKTRIGKLQNNALPTYSIYMAETRPHDELRWDALWAAGATRSRISQALREYAATSSLLSDVSFYRYVKGVLEVPRSGKRGFRKTRVYTFG